MSEKSKMGTCSLTDLTTPELHWDTVLASPNKDNGLSIQRSWKLTQTRNV